MQKYLCSHTFPAGALTPEQICQVAEASQHESRVRGYRSFFNLSGGKAWCVLEADDREAIAAWFEKMEIPYDCIEALELEGERGTIEDLRLHPALA
ncbi:MAG: DUF4242 domain-containing protein [Pirellulales bacterium]|nr:DUF4242 domain-containing protein [Pirellulales bacterium]